MPKCAVTLTVGFGAEAPKATDHISISRIERGDNGEMIVTPGAQPIPMVGKPFPTVSLEQGVVYRFVEHWNGGTTRYCEIPAAETALYRTLDDVTPVPAQYAGVLTDALVSAEIADGDLIVTHLGGGESNLGRVVGADGAPGGSDASFAAWIADDGSDTSAALTAKIAAVSSSGLPRVLARLRNGDAVSVTLIGDSGLEGGTAPTGEDFASRLTGILEDEYDSDVAVQNRAVSGYRSYSALNPGDADPTVFSLALADRADLYVIAFGHNDLRSDTTVTAALPSNGYPLAASIAAVEHMIRRLRIDVPTADIALSTEWQYTGTSAGSNARLVAYNAAVRRLAATYGCALVDFHAVLAALGVTGSNPTVDDLYIHPTGETGAQHPNSEGHRVWAETAAAFLAPTTAAAPSAPAIGAPSFGADRYTHKAWVAIAPTAGDSRDAGTDGYRLSGTWSGTAGAFPRTSTSASAYVEFQFIGSELAVRLDTGAGQGVVKMEVDGTPINASLDLSSLSGTQSRIPLVGLGAGVHRAVVTVVSGSVTLRGAEYLPVIGTRIPHASGAIAYTGTFTTQSLVSLYEGDGQQSTTVNDTVVVEWFGTELWLNGYRYGSTTHRVGVSTDGAAEAVRDLGIPGGASQQGSWRVETGLPYGRHTTTLRVDQSGRALVVSTFVAYDQTRTERPDSIAGVSTVGDVIGSPTALPTKPLVTLVPDDGTSTTPPWPDDLTTSGFTVAGEADAKVTWAMRTARVAY